GRLWRVDQRLGQAPDRARRRGGLGGGGGGEGVRGDAGQREMAEREPHVPAELLFDLLDRVEGLPRVWALVVAVLEDQAAGGASRGRGRRFRPVAPGPAGGHPASRCGSWAEPP